MGFCFPHLYHAQVASDADSKSDGVFRSQANKNKEQKHQRHEKFDVESELDREQPCDERTNENLYMMVLKMIGKKAMIATPTGTLEKNNEMVDKVLGSDPESQQKKVEKKANDKIEKSMGIRKKDEKKEAKQEKKKMETSMPKEQPVKELDYNDAAFAQTDSQPWQISNSSGGDDLA